MPLPMFLKIKNSASLGCVMFTRPARVLRGQNLWPILRLICICYRPVRWSAGACPRARSSVVQLRALSQALKPFSCEMKRKPAASNTRSASSVEITRPESRTGRRGHDVGGFCTSAEIDWMRVRTMPPNRCCRATAGFDFCVKVGRFCPAAPEHERSAEL